MSTRDTVERFADLLVAGDIATAFGMLSENASYTISPNTPGAVHLASRDAVLTKFLGLMPQMFPKGPPTLTISDVLIDGDRGVLIASGTCHGAYETYFQNYCWHLRVRNGEFFEVNEYVDNLAVETALLGSTLTRRE